MLGVEQLDALSRAIPDDEERSQLRQYMEGKHPKHMVCGGASEWGACKNGVHVRRGVCTSKNNGD